MAPTVRLCTRRSVGIRTVFAGSHLSLGPVRALYAEVRAGHDGIIHIGHACALAADGEISAATIVQGGNGGGHKQAVGQFAQLEVRQIWVSLFQILAEHCSLAGHVGGGHGGAAHGLVAGRQ